MPCSTSPLGSSCFFNSTMRKMIFKSQSQLEVIEPSCFENCRLERIEIQRTVKHLTQSRFSNSAIVTVIFESISQLHTIGDSCFLKCTLHDITIRYIPLHDKIFLFLVHLKWFDEGFSFILPKFL
jgi:hypothetical protein